MTQHGAGDRDLNPQFSLDLNAAIAALKAEPTWQGGDRNARTLYKDPADLRVVLTVLKDRGGAFKAFRSRARQHTHAGRSRPATGWRPHSGDAGRLVGGAGAESRAQPRGD